MLNENTLLASPQFLLSFTDPSAHAPFTRGSPKGNTDGTAGPLSVGPLKSPRRERRSRRRRRRRERGAGGAGGTWTVPRRGSGRRSAGGRNRGGGGNSIITVCRLLVRKSPQNHHQKDHPSSFSFKAAALFSKDGIQNSVKRPCPDAPLPPCRTRTRTKPSRVSLNLPPEN